MPQSSVTQAVLKKRAASTEMRHMTQSLMYPDTSTYITL